jgi:acyl dehydratase
MRTIETVEELEAAVGADMGAGDWCQITQEMVTAFAELTGDRQFIHIDPVRAAATPFGGTIAHGYLTLSLLPMLARSRSGLAIGLPSRMVVNYGLNKVRFAAPVRVPARIRLASKIAGVERLSDTLVQVILAHDVELEGSERPAAFVETITRYYL